MLQTVHIRVNDAATGKPTPVRLRVTDADGRYYPPFGHSAEFPVGRDEAVGSDVLLDGERWAYIDGACEIGVPPGELLVAIAKGPDFRPMRETVALPAGKMALRFAIERNVERPPDQYSADLRCHAISPHAALLDAQAEDLDVACILAAETPMLSSAGHSCITYPNLEAFSGQMALLERDDVLVMVGTLNSHPVLGSLALYHCHRIVYPLTFGGADATDDWSLGDWCEQCHRKKGLVVWTGATPSGLHGAEALAQAILGRIDAIELTPTWSDAMTVWRQLLAAGIRLPLVGASGKRSNAVAMGSCRTFVQLNPGESLTPTTWIEAIRSGRTVVSCGSLRFSLDGEPTQRDERAITMLSRRLEAVREWVESEGRFEKDRSREQLLENFDSALRRLRQ